MKRITVISLAVAALAVVVICSTFTFRSAGDDGFMVLYRHQARECEDGGGCAIWSKREIVMTIQAAMQAMSEGGQRRQQRQEPNV